MAGVTTALAERAETIFTDLGYVVERTGPELRAERKWRVVHVTPVDYPPEASSSGDFQCFVTWADQAPDVRERLRQTDPDCEWAVMGVEENGGYEVHRAPEARPL